MAVIISLLRSSLWYRTPLPRAARTYGAFARGYDYGAATQLIGAYGAAGLLSWVWSLDKSRAPEQKILPTMSRCDCCRFGFWLAGAAAA